MILSNKDIMYETSLQYHLSPRAEPSVRMCDVFHSSYMQSLCFDGCLSYLYLADNFCLSSSQTTLSVVTVGFVAKRIAQFIAFHVTVTGHQLCLRQCLAKHITALVQQLSSIGVCKLHTYMHHHQSVFIVLQK